MGQRLNNIYIGELIRQKVEELHWKYSDFARAINCSRSSLYNLFNSKDISVEKLILISRVLDYDFISEVYLSKCKGLELGGKPFIAIPLNEDTIDASAMPRYLLDWLRDQLDV